MLHLCCTIFSLKLKLYTCWEHQLPFYLFSSFLIIFCFFFLEVFCFFRLVLHCNLSLKFLVFFFILVGKWSGRRFWAVGEMERTFRYQYFFVCLFVCFFTHFPFPCRVVWMNNAPDIARYSMTTPNAATVLWAIVDGGRLGGPAVGIKKRRPNRHRPPPICATWPHLRPCAFRWCHCRCRSSGPTYSSPSSPCTRRMW